MKRGIFFVCLVAICADPAPTSALTIVYRDPAMYDQQLNQSAKAVDQVPTRLEFEDSFADHPEVDFGGLVAREVSSAPAVSSRTDYVASGTRALGFTWNGDGFFEFEFQPPVIAFAATILDFGTCCGATDLYVNAPELFWQETAAFGPGLPRGNQQFFGIISDEPLSQLRFFSNNVSDNDLIIFDQVSFLAVPEPASMTGGSIVLAWLILRRRHA